MPTGQVAQIPIGEDQQKKEGEGSEPNREFGAAAVKPSHFIHSSENPWERRRPRLLDSSICFLMKQSRRGRLRSQGRFSLFQVVARDLNDSLLFHPAHFNTFSISATSRSRSMMPNFE